MVVRFEVGDKVRLLHPYGCSVGLGDIGIISFILPSRIVVDFSSHKVYNVQPSNIELVRKAKDNGDVL